jgi:hypothetical protein
MLVFLIILLCATVYVVPGLIALARRHQAWLRVWLINIFLGFTIVGWLWALRDALRRDAVRNHKVFYRYSYYGEETRKKRFDLRQLPGAGDVGMAMGGLAVIAFLGTLGWQQIAPGGSAAIAAAATTAPALQGWTYSQDTTDRGSVHVSTLMSDDGDESAGYLPAALILRSSSGGVSAALKIDGQFTCSAATGGTFTVRFDDAAPERLSCAPRPAGDQLVTSSGQDMMFIANPESFIARANRAHKLTVSADLLGQGARTLRFSPQGLNIAMAGLPEETTVADVEAAKPAAAAVPQALKIAADETATPIADIQPVRRVERPHAARAAKTARAAHKAPPRKLEPDKRTVLHAFHPKSWKTDDK